MRDVFVFTPWDVKGFVDYCRLVTQFGTERITPEILDRIRKTTGELHPMLRRGVFYSHRDLSCIFDRYEKGTPFALYTGGGSSSGSLIVPLVPWLLSQCLDVELHVALY